jgi:hypothetical protein
VITARLRTPGADTSHSIADGFAQALEPTPRKGKLNTQYCQANRYNYQGGARGYDHDNTDCDNRSAQHSYRNPSCRLVGPMNALLDQGYSPLLGFRYFASYCSLLYDHLIVVFVACH